MVAAECVPFAKVGGLADVIGALPLDLEKFGFEPSAHPGHGRVSVGFESVPYDVFRGKIPNSSVEVFLLGNDRFFDRPGIYIDSATGGDYPDQADRWIFFQRAVMEFFKSASPAPDVLHCHDHQTGLISVYLRKIYRTDSTYTQTRFILTIHNMGYQGVFPCDVMARIGFAEADFYLMGSFEFYGKVNFMKVGISYADLITTVSPTYACEIQKNAEF